MRTSPSSFVPSPMQPSLPGVAGQIGNTPLLQLTSVTAGLPEQVSVHAKAEFMNPGGSVKDRAALYMIREGLRTGELRQGKTLIDATSGNTGIAYAMLGSVMNIPVKLALPANASAERKKILQAYGAELVLTNPMDGTDGAQRVVRELVDTDPDRYYYPDQYNNDANWRAHFEGTGAEIIEQTQGHISHFVAGLGTTGTFTGVTRRLKRFDPAIRCYAFQPESPLHGMEGLKHLETAIVPGIYDETLPDDMYWCSTEEAIEMTKRLAREEGVLVGVSSGAAVVIALRVAEMLEKGLVVTVLCDSGSRYLSEPFWK